MLSLLKEKYPNLPIRLQNRHLHDKYGYTVQLIAPVSREIYLNLHRQGSGPISSVDAAGGHINYEAISQIFKYIQDLLETKKIGSRYEIRISLQMIDVAEVIQLVDLIQQVQIQHKTPDLIYQITAVPQGLNIGEQWITQQGMQEFQFRVILRPFSTRKKHDFVEMIRNYSSDIKMSWQLECSLAGGQGRPPWIYNSGFYCKNDGLLTFLSLAAPGVIRKIYRLKHQQ